jgi:hypothetical protein
VFQIKLYDQAFKTIDDRTLAATHNIASRKNSDNKLRVVHIIRLLFRNRRHVELNTLSPTIDFPRPSIKQY